MTPRGFTLVEMMVSVAILALLMGLLAPALSAVRGTARGTRCQSNLRQMGLAAQAYANLYDRWPPAIVYERVDGRLRQHAWDWVTPFFGGGPPLETGPLWSFVDNPGDVMQCPDYQGETNFVDPFTGYNYNTSFLGDEEQFLPTGDGPVRAGVRPHACSRGSSCAMFGDGGRRNGTNKFMRAPLNVEAIAPATLYSGGQAFRHRQATNVAYVDGHVAAVIQARAGRHAEPSLLEQYMDHPRNGFLSDDDSAYDPR